MKNWKEILAEIPEMDKKQLNEMEKAMMVMVIVAESEAPKEQAINVVERYLAVEAMKGSPLMRAEAAYAIAELMQSPTPVIEMFTADPDTFKGWVTEVSIKNFGYAIEGDTETSMERISEKKEKVVKPGQGAEYIGQIINIFEDFLEEKGIQIPNEEKDETDESNIAIIYGTDYGNLLSELEEMMIAWDIMDAN